MASAKFSEKVQDPGINNKIIFKWNLFVKYIPCGNNHMASAGPKRPRPCKFYNETKENPYWQHLSRMKYFEHEAPIDPSSMTRWRKRIGKVGAEELLKETICAGLKTKAGKASPAYTRER